MSFEEWTFRELYFESFFSDLFKNHFQMLLVVILITVMYQYIVQMKETKSLNLPNTFCIRAVKYEVLVLIQRGF